MQNLQSWAKNFNNKLLSFSFSVLGLCFIGFLIYVLTQEGLDLNFIHNNFAVPDYLFVSERAERLTYIINTLLFIPLFWLSFKAVEKYIKIKDDIKFLNISSSLITIILVMALFAGIPYALHFYFDVDLFLIISNFILIILLLFTSCACYYFKDRAFFNTKTFLVLSLIFLFVYIFKILDAFPTEIMDQSFIEAFHFEAFSYPIYKAENGLILGADFKNIYGYYPYFYAFFANIIGPLNTMKITSLTAILLLITWACGIFFIYKITKNKLFALLISIVFVYLTGGNWSYYLQFAPLRIIAFAILLFLATIYTQKQRKYLIFLGFFCSSLALVWNFETGLINIIAWTAFLCYFELNNSTIKEKAYFLNLLKYLFYAAISLILSLLAFKFIPYLLIGKTVMLWDILFVQNMFYKQGFMMAKIIPSHPWFLPLIIYMISLILCLKPILNKQKNTDRDLPLLLFLSVFGLGIYTYYQGRSFISNLITVLFPAILILPILLKKIYQQIPYLKTKSTENVKNLFYILHFTVFETIAFGAMLLLFCVFIINTPQRHKVKQDWPLQSNAASLSNLIKDKNPIIFTLDSAYYYKALNKKDIFPVAAPIDFFFKQDYYNLFSYLDRNKTSIVLDKEQLARMKKFVPAQLKEFINKTKHTRNNDFVLFEYKN